MTLQKEGFQTLVRGGIDLSVGSTVTVNAQLVVGSVQEKVEVTAEAPAVETAERNDFHSRYPGADGQNLPLNGRSLLTHWPLLAPGVFVNHYIVSRKRDGWLRAASHRQWRPAGSESVPARWHDHE